MIVLLVVVSEMKVDTFKQKLQEIVELSGDMSVAAFALSLMFNVLACQMIVNIHFVHMSASGDSRDALVHGMTCIEPTNLQGS